MSSPQLLWAIVPAAGVGRRMESAIPKQYLPLAKRNVLQVTLDKLLSWTLIQSVLVAVSAEDTLYDQQIRQDARIERLNGGRERADSVLNGLQVLMERGCENDFVLVHDAARPCFLQEKLEALWRQAQLSEHGAMLVAPVADTVKEVVGNRVINTVDRQRLRLAHTPQIFKVGLLYQALKSAEEQGLTVTDESSAMELAGFQPHAVVDARTNIKITQPEDLALAEWILQQQS